MNNVDPTNLPPNFGSKEWLRKLRGGSHYAETKCKGIINTLFRTQIANKQALRRGLGSCSAYKADKSM